MVSHSACNTRERRSKGGHLEWWYLSFQVTATCGGSLISWRRLNTCLSVGSNKGIPFFTLPVAGCKFPLPIKLYFNPQGFSLAHFWVSCNPSSGEWVRSSVGLRCWLGIKNDSSLYVIVNVSLLWLFKCIHTVFF